jgi:hypothetical protein
MHALSSHAQVAATEQLVMNFEKLQQLEAILDNMYKGYVILDRGYNTIKNIAEGNFSIHDVLINGLFLINPAIRDYRKIPYIISYQQFLMKEYRQAYDQFRADPNFTLKEIQYMFNVYNFLIKTSLRNLEELLMIVSVSNLQMSDEERLQGIDRIYTEMADKLSFLRCFNNGARLMGIQRARDHNDASALNKLYGLTQ